MVNKSVPRLHEFAQSLNTRPVGIERGPADKLRHNYPLRHQVQSIEILSDIAVPKMNGAEIEDRRLYRFISVGVAGLALMIRIRLFSRSV